MASISSDKQKSARKNKAHRCFKTVLCQLNIQYRVLGMCVFLTLGLLVLGWHLSNQANDDRTHFESQHSKTELDDTSLELIDSISNDGIRIMEQDLTLDSHATLLERLKQKTHPSDFISEIVDLPFDQAIRGFLEEEQIQKQGLLIMNGYLDFLGNTWMGLIQNISGVELTLIQKRGDTQCQKLHMTLQKDDVQKLFAS